MSETNFFTPQPTTPAKGTLGKVGKQTPVAPAEPQPKAAEPISNTDSFFNTINIPRQEVPEPPKPGQTETETAENEQNKAADTETPTEAAETEKAPISQAGIEVTAEFYTETGDLIIPKILAWVNKTADEGKYELKPKQKQYIVDSWVRFLNEKQHQLTPTQQLISAYVGGYGTEMLLIATTRLLEYFDKKNKREAQSQVIEPKQPTTPAEAPQPQQATNVQQPAPATTVAEPQNEPRPKENNNVINPEGYTETKYQQTTEQPPEQNENKTFKPCANNDCNKTFEPGQGFAKNKKSKFYDTTCSKACMSKVIGATGGRKNKNQ